MKGEQPKRRLELFNNNSSLNRPNLNIERQVFSYERVDKENKETLEKNKIAKKSNLNKKSEDFKDYTNANPEFYAKPSPLTEDYSNTAYSLLEKVLTLEENFCDINIPKTSYSSSSSKN